jgi:secreted trypsin-like serine protease
VTTINVACVDLHPGFSATDHSDMDNDIAVLTLPQDIPDSVKPIALARSTNGNISKGASLTTAGWGDAYEGELNPHGQDTPSEVEVPYVPNTGCSAMRVGAGEMCAGNKPGGTDACQGVSGSPLFRQHGAPGEKPVLAGVVSWGRGCAHPDAYDVYSRVSQYSDWLDSKTCGIKLGSAPSARTA